MRPGNCVGRSTANGWGKGWFLASRWGWLAPMRSVVSTKSAAATDGGYVVNLEAYTPELQGLLSLPGNLRGVVFYDFANGWNNEAIAPTITKAAISSWGVGLRYSYDKNTSFRVDLAQVLENGPVAATDNRSVRGHFSLSVGF